ncbi:MAG TPA: ATP-dependent DNA ligase [Chloroflexota bacterium]
MLMRELAGSLARIEATTKRLEMMAILAELFRRASRDEIDAVVYLLEGQLGPPFAAPEIGVNERRIPLVIAEVAGVDPGQVEAAYRELGDLGLVAERFLPKEGRPTGVRSVFDALWEIARVSGPGSATRKLQRLGQLLRQLGAFEARYVVRFVQGRLRLGIGDPTIMDGLSEAVAGDRRLRPVIERAYNLCSDLGLVAKTLLEAGPEALKRFTPIPGKPIRVALAQRANTPEEALRKLRRVIAEPKYDGLRLQLHKIDDRVKLFTRRLEDVTDAFPDLAVAARRQLRAATAIVDGEAIAHNPETGEFVPFQLTVRRKRKYAVEAMAERYPLNLFAFDLLYADGRATLDLPLRERRRLLEAVVAAAPDDPIQVTPALETADPAALGAYFDEMVTRGLEGLVVKNPDAPYHAGQRKADWIKVKRGARGALADTVDVVVVGYLLGKGKRAKLGIGSLVGAVYDPDQDRFRTVAKIGSGLSEEQWREMKRVLDAHRTPRRPARVDAVLEPDVWVEPFVVVEVRADEITRSPVHTCGKAGDQPGYALRFPRVVGFIRTDRRPEDATTEREILELYELQLKQPGRPVRRRRARTGAA